MQAHEQVQAGLGALSFLRRRRDGLGVPGPYGANPSQMISAGKYEVSGTGVNFRAAPSTGAQVLGIFNADTSQGDKVVGTPEQVDFDGQTATGNGLTWAHVTAKGQTGYIAVEYLAPVGWTASKGYVTSGGGGGGAENVSLDTSDSSSSSGSSKLPYILGGVAAAGLLAIGVVAMTGKKGKKHKKHAHGH